MVIRNSATRSHLLTIVLLVGALAGAACTRSTVGLTPHVEQPATAPTLRGVAQPSLTTPEAAVKLYVESLAANDFAAALRACAVHEPAARFDFTSSMRFVIHFSPKLQKAPTEYPLFVEINELGAEAHVAAATKNFVYHLLTDRDPMGSQPVESDAEIEAFVQAVNPARLARLRVVRIDRARRLLTDSREAQAIFKGQATREGADETTERIALYELSGQSFWSGFRLSRYDRSWKISELGASYGGPSEGGVRKTTAAEYEARLASESEPELEPPPQVETAIRAVKTKIGEKAVQGAVRPCEQSIEGLATPEAAVNFYVESVAKNDFACALRAYAAHENAARFDFKALVSWVKVLSPGRLKAPAQYPMFVAMNEAVAKAEMAQATKLFVYGLLTDTNLSGVQQMESDAEIRAFLQAVNPARLATVKVVRIDPPRQSELNSPEAQALFERVATHQGADEMTARIALYELSGQLFWSGFELCRYDKRWKICSLESSFGGPFDVVEKTTAAQYEARLR